MSAPRASHVVLRWRALDDRGRTVRLDSRIRIPLDAPLGTWFPLKLANHSLMVVLVGCVLGLALLGGALTVLRSAHLSAAGREFVTSDTVRQMLLPFLAVVTLATGMLAIGRRMRKRATRECVRIGLCPACGYSIDALVVADDRCRVCPECGAAWSVPGVG
jgi:hypothetical protein